MKRFSLFMLTALLCLSLTGANASPTVTKAHKSAHKINMPSLMGGGGSCSATAIGPHALLTATHCVAASAVLTVDGDDFGIVTIISDGLDHSIYLLDGPHAFVDYSAVDLNDKPEQGDRVFLFGNPGGFEDMYREGYVSGYEKPVKEDDSTGFDLFNPFLGRLPKIKTHSGNDAIVRTYYDFNGYFGDSGSGIFNHEGKVIGITSFIQGQSERGYSIKFMGGFEMRFTQKQLNEAREFNPNQ
jgi:hypothetical protein